MAISRIAGQMLQSNLERDGVDLSIDTNLTYFDVSNNRVGINTVSPNVALDVNGNINASNLTTTANISGGNASITSNISGGNLLTGGLISATGNVAGGNLTTGGIVNATGNVQGGNLTTVGQVVATANVTGGNLITTGNVSAGNVLVGYITIPTTGNIDVGNTYIANLADPSQNQDAATKYYVDNQVGNIGNIGNLTVVDTTISASTANANIFIDPPGIGQFQIVGTNGFVVPAGATGDRPDPVAQGTVRFNTTTNQLEVYDGSEWDGMGGQAVITNQQIIPDGTSDTYTLDQSATADGILVTMNGVSQTPGNDYTVTGNQITFTTIPLSSDVIQVRFIAGVTTIAGLTNSTANSSVTVTNTPSIVFEVNSSNVAVIDQNEIFNINGCHSLQLPSYTVAQATALTNVVAGQTIYVTNGDSGNPCLAVYNGSAWKRVSLGATIST